MADYDTKFLPYKET